MRGGFRSSCQCSADVIYVMVMMMMVMVMVMVMVVVVMNQRNTSLRATVGNARSFSATSVSGTISKDAFLLYTFQEIYAKLKHNFLAMAMCISKTRQFDFHTGALIGLQCHSYQYRICAKNSETSASYTLNVDRHNISGRSQQTVSAKNFAH